MALIEEKHQVIKFIFEEALLNLTKDFKLGKDPDAGRDWGQEEKGTTENEMAGWHHRLDGHKFE